MNFIFISPNFPKIYSHFVKELHDKGIHVFGIGDEPLEFLNEELKNNLDEYCYVSDMNRYDWMRNTVEYLTNKYGPIDFIESNNEYWMKTDAKLREEFGVKNGYRLEDLQEYQCKSKMKKYFKEAGLKTARYIMVSSLDNSLDFVKKVGYPVFAKPDAGVGASETYKINNENELIEFHKKELHEPYIMEEFINGYIISFDGISNKDAEVVICFKETFPTPIAEVVTKNSDVYYYAESKLNIDYKKMGERIVKSFNITERCFHIELFVLKDDKKGLAKKGEIVALEANLRSPGGDTPELLNLVSKIDYYKAYASMICDNISSLNNETNFIAVSANRKNNFNYLFSHDEIMNKYKNNIVKFGYYPPLFRDAMGDMFYLAKFTTKKNMKNFVDYVNKKSE